MQPNPQFDRSKLPDGFWQSARVVSILQNHFRWYLLLLIVKGRAPAKPGHPLEKAQVFHASGFLMYYDESLLWVTAGHVIDKLNELKNPAVFTIEEMLWLDGYDDYKWPPAPAHYRNPTMNSWTDEGIDIGAILLDKLDRRSLLRNERLRPLRLGASLTGEFPPDAYYLVGFPDEYTGPTSTQESATQVRIRWETSLACLPLEPIQPSDRPNDHEFWDHQQSKYARILPYPDMPDFKLESITGMSGGPVLAIRLESATEMGVRLMGVQSSWLRSTRSIRYEPSDRLVELLDAWLRI